MSDLERIIREAATKCRGQKWVAEGVDGLSTENGEPVVFDGGYDTSGFCQDEQREFCIAASPANILALLAEKDAEIERWKAAASEYQDGMYETATRAEAAEQERDEWKRIAGDLADPCELLRKYDARPFSERVKNQKAIDAYDVLAGRGE